MKNKKAISLIVLVITIIILSVLATVIIINISNTNIISEAQSAVDKYSLKEIESGIQLEKASMIIENEGEEPNMFELIERVYSKGIITASQREEMIKNGGELVIGDDVLRLDVKSIIYFKNFELVSETAPYSIRGVFAVNKISYIENITFNEIGCVIANKKHIDRVFTELAAESKFKLDAYVNYGISYRTNTYDDFDWEDGNVARFVFYNIPQEQVDTKIAFRSYIKYTYDGIDGIVYSDIAYSSVNDLM